MRRTDLLARYGGEEFAVMLRDCTHIEAVVVLDDLRALMPAGQTFSAGVVEWDGQEAPERLVGRADRALYEAKHAGRDRIIVAPSRHDDQEPPATSSTTDPLRPPSFLDQIPSDRFRYSAIRSRSAGSRVGNSGPC